MRALRVACVAILAAGCGAPDQGEVVSLGAHPVAVRACRLHDEPASACRGAPEDTAPFSEEVGGPTTRWLSVPRGGLVLESQRSVWLDKQQWYEVALPGGVHGFVPTPLAEALPGSVVLEPVVVATTLRVLPEEAE